MRGMVFPVSLVLAAGASLVLLASSPPRPSVRVGLAFSMAPGVAFKTPGVGVAAIAAEAEAIWRPHGVAIRAVSLLDPVPPEAFDVLVSVQLVSRLDPPSSGSPSLGAIVFQKNEGFEPVLRIAVDSVDDTLKDVVLSGRPLAAWPAGAASAARWRAMGRVLAHELGHYLVGLPVHRAGGLMRRGFSSQALAGPDRTDFRLDAIDVPRLCARLGHLSSGSTLERLAQTGGLRKGS